MDTLKKNMMSEIKKAFDAYLEDADEEACNYLLFDDLDDLQDCYDDFVQDYFNSDDHKRILGRVG